MSRPHIPDSLRERVRQRAGYVCEYCLLHEDDTIHRFQVDHVISEKHQGPTEVHNLAYCCPFCNRAKGSDIAGRENEHLVRLYNPRIDTWSDHFVLDAEHIRARTEVGAVTLRLLGINSPHRKSLRQALIAAGIFPTASASRLAK